MLKADRGFSIIELLVVVSIIMVVTTAALISYSSTGRRSRDSRRISDLKKISLALEMYRQEVGIYPSSLGGLIPDYMDVGSTSDPKNYSYYYSSPGDYTYTLDGRMEDVGNTTGVYGANCTGICNYRIVNP